MSTPAPKLNRGPLNGYHLGDQTLLAQPPELMRLFKLGLGDAPDSVGDAIAQVARLLEREGSQLARNYRLGTGDDARDHVDFMVGHVAVVVDFPIPEQGPRWGGTQLARLLQHYAASRHVNTLLVVTNRDIPRGTVDEASGKRIAFWVWR